MRRNHMPNIYMIIGIFILGALIGILMNRVLLKNFKYKMGIYIGILLVVLTVMIIYNEDIKQFKYLVSLYWGIYGGRTFSNPKKSKQSAQKNTPELPFYPGNNPKKCPDVGWKWCGRGEEGSEEGFWYNPKTEEALKPDLHHSDFIPPHWDYRDPNGDLFKLFPDGRRTQK